MSLPPDDPEARARINGLGLDPKHHPLGYDHHTDKAPSPQDEAIGDALAWYLGSMWVDIDPNYFYFKRTSVDEWTRVARALRIHGLKIVNATED